MQKHLEKTTILLDKVFCNRCGKVLRVENGIIQEGVLSVRADWGYFSEKDGQTHTFDICEACYNKMIAEFAIPVDVKKQIELV